MEDDQQFCLRWNNHQSTLIQNFDTLLESGTLVDCTLAAEGKYLKAHKVVLSACSPYFEGLLSEHYDKHPVFILKDVKFKELKAMMDYMYRGEVNISQDQLAALLKAAESLQIKGLSESKTSGSSKTDSRLAKVAPQPTAPPLDISYASSGLTIEKNKVPRQGMAQGSVGDLPEDSASPQVPKGLSSREGSQSPTARKRKRFRRRSVGEDNSVENHEASNSSDMPQQMVGVPALGIAPVADEKTHADPTDSLGRSALMTQLTKPADEMLQLPLEKPEPNDNLIEPKSEYLEDPEESVEDLTLDDDMNDLNEMEQDNNRAGPSHDPSQHPAGLGAWHVTGDRSNAGGVVGSVAGAPGTTDEVFLAAQEAAQAHRDSQEVVEMQQPEESTTSEKLDWNLDSEKTTGATPSTSLEQAIGSGQDITCTQKIKAEKASQSLSTTQFDSDMDITLGAAEIHPNFKRARVVLESTIKSNSNINPTVGAVNKTKVSNRITVESPFLPMSSSDSDCTVEVVQRAKKSNNTTSAITLSDDSDAQTIPTANTRKSSRVRALKSKKSEDSNLDTDSVNGSQKTRKSRRIGTKSKSKSNSRTNGKKIKPSSTVSFAASPVAASDSDMDATSSPSNKPADRRSDRIASTSTPKDSRGTVSRVDTVGRTDNYDAACLPSTSTAEPNFGNTKEVNSQNSSSTGISEPDSIPSIEGKNIPQIEFGCSYCTRKFLLKHHVAKHEKYSCGKNKNAKCSTMPFACIHCSQRFRLQKFLNYHEKHECNITHICPFCKQPFLSRLSAKHLARCKAKALKSSPVEVASPADTHISDSE